MLQFILFCSIGPQWVDESEIFYSDPEEWLRKKYKSEEMFPSHLVLFDCLVPVSKRHLRGKNTFSCSSIIHVCLFCVQVLESFMEDHHYVEVMPYLPRLLTRSRLK